MKITQEKFRRVAEIILPFAKFWRCVFKQVPLFSVKHFMCWFMLGISVNLSLAYIQIRYGGSYESMLDTVEQWLYLWEMVGEEEGEMIGKPTEGKDENNGSKHLDHSLPWWWWWLWWFCDDSDDDKKVEDDSEGYIQSIQSINDELDYDSTRSSKALRAPLLA